MQAKVSQPERKYALTKIRSGDWLLPSNDGKTIWRLSVYEDGPSHGLEDMKRDRDFWGVWKWIGGTGPTVDVEDWDAWEMCADGMRSRAEAIQRALRHG